MALTITPAIQTVVGNKRLVVADVAFDSSYPTGGEAITPADFGLQAIQGLVVSPHATRICTWDRANSKLMLYTALNTQAANSSDQSSVTVTVTALGY